MTDLLQPDIPALLAKWAHVLDVVLPFNQFDTPGELAWLCEAVSRVGDILECGSYCAVSTKAMALANPNARIYSVDRWDDAGSHEAYLERMGPEIEAGRVSYFVGNTVDRLAQFARMGMRFDMAFLDAGHLYPDVLADIQSTVPLLRPDAILCGHDYREHDPRDGVNLAVSELLPRHRRVVDSIWCAESTES